MGNLTEKIRADLTAAMKAQEKERLSTLRMLQSALKNEQIKKLKQTIGISSSTTISYGRP